MIVAISTAAIAGFASTVHCGLMCGPIAVCAAQAPRGLFQYHAARLLSYGTLGALVGASGSIVQSFLPTSWAAAMSSITIGGALLLVAFRVWREGRPVRDRTTVQLRRASTPAPRRTPWPRHPAAVGLLTAFLPCGTLYAALLVASGSGSALAGGFSMVAFGTASALGLAAFGWVATRVGKSHTSWWRPATATVLVAGAALLVAQGLSVQGLSVQGLSARGLGTPPHGSQVTASVSSEPVAPRDCPFHR